MSDNSYRFHQLPNSPPTAADVQQYKEFRLLSLKTDPKAYSSTYEGEGAFTDQQWFERLRSDSKGTIVATLERPGEITEEWAGMITVLSPQLTDFTDYIPSKLKEKRGVESVYIVVGMWVHPEHRRRGVAGQLIEQAVHWVRNRRRDREEGGGGTLLLEVVKSNDGAASMYTRSRFEEVNREGTSSDKESTFMYLDVNGLTSEKVCDNL
ncbi:hypothetical protein E1B28_012090 [Marasmius oreades]|uniref:N-acetyltransferase domain-containing protein n=1 Tax=Marasmius oreades TaxID=181124 RepID=A0A9P7RRD9_9AGAR|nr:uncharacterized protein E1B28_012090 [Marasmius oreades]KAG7088057.1 hypothetical protein E1B28_012090 [Marasmius oreades]